jgi:hypothetical protein
MKSYTDIEQSRKLEKILPVESADLFYKAGNDTQPTFRLHSYGHIMSDKDVCAWSLAALLNVLNFPSLTQNKENEWEVCVLDHNNDGYVETTGNNPVDACYEMILKLNELNLL